MIPNFWPRIFFAARGLPALIEKFLFTAFSENPELEKSYIMELISECLLA